MINNINCIFILICVILPSIILAETKTNKKRNFEHKDKSNDNEKDNIWEQDLGDTFKIDATTQGLQKVHLKCGSDSMYVQLETDEDFTGVMYTRGSFYKQAEPCFVKPKKGKSSRSLAMRFPLDQCQTLQDGDIYSNVVVIQHDPELVTPGDAAFSLECDFRQPRSLTVNADLQARERLATGSRITLTSPDPSARADVDKPTGQHDTNTVHKAADSVTFVPKDTSTKAQKVRGTVESIPLEHKLSKDEL